MTDLVRNSRPDDASLDWLAFRYVSGEMTDGEVEVFETQLAADSESFSLAACEAVAQAVQLCNMAVVAFDSEHKVMSEPVADLSASQKFTGQRESTARRVSIAASAAAVVAAGLILSSSDPERIDEVVSRETSPLPAGQLELASELVSFWANSDDELDFRFDEHPLLPAGEVPDTRTDDVPDWLFAAIQSQQSAGDESTRPEVMEN